MRPFKLLLIVVFAFTSSAVFSAQTEPGLKAAETNKIGIQPKFNINNKTPELGTLKERMAGLNIPAVSIAFMESHKISWTLTEGVVDFVSQQQIDNNTVFQTASISKPMFATVLLKYRQEQGLNLDTDVNTLLKSWQLPKRKLSKSSPANLRRLLGQPTVTSVHEFRADAAGIGGPSILNVLNGAGLTNSKAILMDIEPVTTLRYSDKRATLAQLVLQDQSRVPLPELTKTLILNPLSVKHSAYSKALSGQLTKNAAVPHRSIGLPIDGGSYTYATLATAGLWTTPTDLLKLASKIQRSYQGLDKSFITSKTVSEMLTLQVESMRIGFFLEKQDGTVTSFTHGGANDGFRANLFIHAQTGDGIAIMTNSDNGGDLINDLLSRVSEVYGWNESSQIETIVAARKPDLRQLIIDGHKVKKPFQSALMLVAEGEQF